MYTGTDKIVRVERLVGSSESLLTRGTPGGQIIDPILTPILSELVQPNVAL